MKRVYKSKEEPELLRQYRLHNPCLLYTSDAADEL